MEFALNKIAEMIYLPKALDDQLRAAAKRENVPLNDLVVRAISQTVAQLDESKILEGIEHENIA